MLQVQIISQIKERLRNIIFIKNVKYRMSEDWKNIEYSVIIMTINYKQTFILYPPFSETTFRCYPSVDFVSYAADEEILSNRD